jgi:hypothetical protein
MPSSSYAALNKDESFLARLPANPSFLTGASSAMVSAYQTRA